MRLSRIVLAQSNLLDDSWPWLARSFGKYAGAWWSGWGLVVPFWKIRGYPAIVSIGWLECSKGRGTVNLIEEGRFFPRPRLASAVQSAGRRHRVPFDERPRAKQAVMDRPQQVSADPKHILHGTVHRQEALRVADEPTARSAAWPPPKRKPHP